MTDFETIILILVSIAVGFFLGVHTARERMLEIIERTISSEESENTINVYVEEKDDSIFVYNAETNDYMAHASDPTQLIVNLNKRFPGKQYMASEKDFAILTGRLK